MTEETLFHEALARPPEERAAFLDAGLRRAAGTPGGRRGAAGGPRDVGQHPRPARRHRPDRGFRARARPITTPRATTRRSPPTRRSRPPRPPTTARCPSPASSSPAATRCIEKIGEGGMGEVWVAKQTEPVKRKVALKLIKAGMDSQGGAAALRAGAAGAGADGPSQHRQGARRRPDARPASRSSSWSWSTACR